MWDRLESCLLRGAHSQEVCRWLADKFDGMCHGLERVSSPAVNWIALRGIKNERNSSPDRAAFESAGLKLVDLGCLFPPGGRWLGSIGRN